MKILVIQQKMIGDVLTSSILFEVLRKEFPNAQLHYLIHKHTLAVVENNPFIDRFILFEEADAKPENFFFFLRKIRKEEYNIVIDVYSKIGTAVLSRFSGAEITVSYDKWYTRRFYSYVSRRASKAQTSAGLAVEIRLKLLEPIVKNIPEKVKPKIWLTEEEVSLARKTIQQAAIPSDKLLLMISVLGSSENKTYPHNYLAILLDQIVEEKRAHLLFNYIPSQLEEAQNIYNLCKPATRKHIHLKIFGKSLREFIALTSRCDALIGNEGGAVNMAKAVNVPTFAIFSPAIKKEDWSIFEDNNNTSVHLKDFKPELLKNVPVKELRRNSQEFYRHLKPDYIAPALSLFLNMLKSKKS